MEKLCSKNESGNRHRKQSSGRKVRNRQLMAQPVIPYRNILWTGAAVLVNKSFRCYLAPVWFGNTNRKFTIHFSGKQKVAGRSGRICKINKCIPYTALIPPIYNIFKISTAYKCIRKSCKRIVRNPSFQNFFEFCNRNNSSKCITSECFDYFTLF